MTEPSASAPRPEPAQHVQIWAESFAQVLGQIAGSAFPCAVVSESPADLAPAADGDLWIACACSGGLRGEMYLRLPAASTLRLAQIFMSEPAASEAELTPDHRDATVELLRQVSGLVASSLKAGYGEVQLRLEPSAGAPSWAASLTAWLRLGNDSATAVATVEVGLSAALVAAWRAEKPEAAKPAPGVAAPSPAASSSAASSSVVPAPAVPSSPAAAPFPPQDGSVKLDLLMDVELGVTLRFGRRRLLLREVLDLNPGSVVDLDRKVQEPVDVLLDGRLIARGEVVVMDGNYGLRVTEVAPAGGL